MDSVIQAHSKYRGKDFVAVPRGCICLASTYNLDTKDMISCGYLGEARTNHCSACGLMHEPAS